MNKAALLSKRELKEVEVSEQERETTITHSALETDEKARVEKDTLKQEEKAGEIQGEHDMQISSLTERIAQKQKAEAVVIEDRGADCRHENVIHVPVFQVRGEPRRVLKKCLDCGKVLEKDRISR